VAHANGRIADTGLRIAVVTLVAQFHALCCATHPLLLPHDRPKRRAGGRG
jgi:hypothetical protein